MSTATAIIPSEQAETPIVTYGDYSILLVDDTPNNLDVLVDFLKEYGFALRIALSGESALERIRYDAPSIVLLDVLLPGIDGFETCRQLKADPATVSIPVIFMTSLASAEDKVRGFEVGAVDYVTKPLQQAEVLARITTHLQQQELTQELRARNEQLVQSQRTERARLLQAVAEQRGQLRALAAKLTEVQEGERQRLARELHDEMGQALTAIRMDLASVQKELPDSASARVEARLAEATQLVDETLEQIRELSLDLRPSMLDDLGLIPTLRWYINRFRDRTGLHTTFLATNVERGQRLLPLLETALYRIVQESLTNVTRHAAATKVLVYLEIAEVERTATAPQSQNIVLRIEDNGCGFAPESVFVSQERMRGVGLLGMRERVSSLGGAWQLHAAPGAGTRIKIRLPLEKAL